MALYKSSIDIDIDIDLGVPSNWGRVRGAALLLKNYDRWLVIAMIRKLTLFPGHLVYDIQCV